MSLIIWLGSVILAFFTIPADRLDQTPEAHVKALGKANNLMRPFWSKAIREKHVSAEIRAAFKEATAIYRRVIAQNDDAWEAYLYLGRSQRAFQRPMEACQTLTKAYELMPENLSVISEYVLACLEANDIKTAYQVLKPAAKSFPDDYLLKKQIIYILILSKQPQMALTAIDNLIRQIPSHSKNHAQFLAEVNGLREFCVRLLANQVMPPTTIYQLLKKAEQLTVFDVNKILATA
ncbi:tetratricopeptide repeat protein [Ostreibacterium oceani]|uniref:Uncharacterized protein n=1 Tax=Ostreibacterium oceani TaxID=2654998 RepID=A0A6N7EVZ5_9GAMM|nr:hypothetical protein [Ostreibacterium oceani]MPV85599.1 hypothetical protein [Ostreibacterium oceani]